MYKHVLLATDLSEDTHSVAVEAFRQAAASEAKLSMVYVIEPISVYGFPLITDQGIAKVQHVKEAMLKLCDELNISVHDKHTETGSAKNEVLALAEKLGVDLIVVGSHGRHGVSKLLGSTATGIVQGSSCSVLVSHIT